MTEIPSSNTVHAGNTDLFDLKRTQDLHIEVHMTSVMMYMTSNCSHIQPSPKSSACPKAHCSNKFALAYSIFKDLNSLVFFRKSVHNIVFPQCTSGFLPLKRFFCAMYTKQNY